MTELLELLDYVWNIMWFPLWNLSLDNFVIACPLLFLILTFVFGMLFKFMQGVLRS